MDVLSDIQPAERPKENLPLGLIEAGLNTSCPGAHFLRPEGNSCPELWDHAQGLFNQACKELDNKEHHRKLMDAGMAFAQVVLATGHFPIEKSYALNNLGLIMQAMNHMEKAEQSFAHALSMNPDNATIRQNYATCRMIKGDLKGAQEWFYKALDKDPKCAEARWNSALIALSFGDFRRGFLNYEWRWKCGTFTWRPFQTSMPKWKGQDLKGKTILLTHEQGFGDSIMFIRYAKMVKARGAEQVHFAGVPELECILKDVEGLEGYISLKDDAEWDALGETAEFDYHCPLLSLPRIFKTRLETVPWDGPYIHWHRFSGKNHFTNKSDPHHFQLSGDQSTWCALCNREQMDPIHRNVPKRIGIAWAGRKAHANDGNRSMALDQFAPLFDLPGINWYSLQFGDRAAEAEKYPKIYSPPIKTFADTAWWLSQLDLLISVDTSVIHLAGAMGRPVWNLLPYAADWRWMIDREDSPWYGGMRLFRQSVKGQWGDVIQRVKEQLLKLKS